jgi:hypothetical protein
LGCPNGCDAAFGTCKKVTLVMYDAVQPVISVVANAPSGYDTYDLAIMFRSGGTGKLVLGKNPNVYAMFGHHGSGKPLTMPSAYQYASLGGATIGGINPALLKLFAALKYDSWLTVGKTTGKGQDISFIENDDGKTGIAEWGKARATPAAQTPLNVTDGAVFWKKPTLGCRPKTLTDKCMLARLTVHRVTNSKWTANINLHGRASDSVSAAKWEQENIKFTALTQTTFKTTSALSKSNQCTCKAGMFCVAGCTAPYKGHKCGLSAVPTATPTSAPTQA